MSLTRAWPENRSTLSAEMKCTGPWVGCVASILMVTSALRMAQARLDYVLVRHMSIVHIYITQCSKSCSKQCMHICLYINLAHVSHNVIPPHAAMQVAAHEKEKKLWWRKGWLYVAENYYTEQSLHSPLGSACRKGRNKSHLNKFWMWLTGRTPIPLQCSSQ